MAYTETKHTSYGGRLKNSLGGIGTGIVLFIGATVLLWWNEGRAVKTAKTIEETEEACVELVDISKVDANFNGQVVHATGATQTSDSLRDADFNVSVNAVQLSRKVEYYQYEEKSSEETKDNLGGSQDKTTTYTYEQKWTSKPVNSSEFKDPQYQSKNFVLIALESKKVYAENVAFGAYKLNKSQIEQMSGESAVAVALGSEKKKQWSSSCGSVARQHGNNASDSSFVSVNGNVVYFGSDPSNPKVGDVRVTFTKVDASNISIIAKVMGDTFTSNVVKGKGNYSRLNMGTIDAEQMFESSKESNSNWTWALRILGVLLVIAGLRSLFNIVIAILKVLPPLATVANVGVGLVCGVVGLVWSLVIIAIAWLFYRPILSVIILAVVGALAYFLIKRSKEKKAQGGESEQQSGE